ncbi:vacuolar ATPase assembly protein VMA22 [Archocentrus centrarchus]|uniref:vacuolar ATPase assembly protein VMA22 n=1 Tax=Archocentrus centrarchus TaxID=63155 RepID=UPI0011EA3546|nr:coiled-coil domain-containing protein 115 [Archocentrus centrarchus]
MGVSEVEESFLLLDEKLLRFMEQLELLEEKRATFNSLIEQGWFSMSKARYTMGNKQVSALQYASELKPLVCVHTRMLDNGEVDFSTERFTQTCSKESGKDQKAIEDIGPQEEGVRRRNRPKKGIAEKEESESTSSEKPPAAKRDQNPHQDPLKWFGVLVPQSLKHAQSSFKQVIELSAQIAALQTAVLSARQELKHSLQNKHIPGERLSSSAGQGSRLDASAESKQEGAEKELPATDSQ